MSIFHSLALTRSLKTLLSSFTRWRCLPVRTNWASRIGLITATFTKQQ